MFLQRQRCANDAVATAAAAAPWWRAIKCCGHVGPKRQRRTKVECPLSSTRLFSELAFPAWMHSCFILTATAIVQTHVSGHKRVPDGSRSCLRRRRAFDREHRAASRAAQGRAVCGRRGTRRRPATHRRPQRTPSPTAAGRPDSNATTECGTGTRHVCPGADRGPLSYVLLQLC